VLALIALPIIDVSLALADPEERLPSFEAIDRMHVLNDLLRWPGSPCFVDEAPPPPPSIEPPPTAPTGVGGP
jgi:hypothetical protein